MSHSVEMSLAVDCEVGPFWKVLPQQTVGIFVAASLPWAVRIAEVDLDSSGNVELEVVCEFLASIPR